MVLDVYTVKSGYDTGLDVKELTIEDFATGDKNNFTPDKLRLIASRLKSDNYKCFGIIEDQKLIYSTWISFGILTLPNGDRFKLNDDEGLLEDSYCDPIARGRGLHSKMNFFRIMKFKEAGTKYIIAIVLDGNTPAMKVQLKSGFKEINTFYSGKIFGRNFSTLKRHKI